MRRVTRNGVIAVFAASGAMAMAVPAHADASADGATADSPGVIAGNTIQLPVHLPVNACGNTVSVVGLLNPAMGNRCANTGGGKGGSGASNGGGAVAQGAAEHSPGVVSGNGIQLPVELPVNASGNSVNVAGVLNPVFGNDAVNGPVAVGRDEPPAPEPQHPQRPPASQDSGSHRPVGSHGAHEAVPVPVPVPAAPQPGMRASLAATGADGVVPAAVGAGALLVAGAAMYRRGRRA